MQVKLPDWAGEFIQSQVAAGRFESADQFLTELLDQARVMVPDDQLAELIQEGLDSDEGEEMTDAWWERRTAELRAEAARRRSA